MTLVEICICGELRLFLSVFVSHWIFQYPMYPGLTGLAAAENIKVLKMYVCSKVSNIWKKPSVIVQNKITPWTKEPRVGGKRNNNLLPKMLSPQLCQLLYIFIVNWIQMWAMERFFCCKNQQVILLFVLFIGLKIQPMERSEFLLNCCDNTSRTQVSWLSGYKSGTIAWRVC